MTLHLVIANCGELWGKIQLHISIPNVAMISSSCAIFSGVGRKEIAQKRDKHGEGKSERYGGRMDPRIESYCKIQCCSGR